MTSLPTGPETASDIAFDVVAAVDPHCGHPGTETRKAWRKRNNRKLRAAYAAATAPGSPTSTKEEERD